MAQQLMVNLSFTADASRAKKEISDLQRTLSTLSSSTSAMTGDNIMTQFNQKTIEANQNVAKLQAALKTATNVDTGKLNLSKFNQTLKESGLSLGQVRDSLVSLGPQGQRAFVQVAQSIMQADVQIKTTNKLVDGLWTSLKNVARWEVSKALFTGFIGTFQTAFSYAEDLNKSLNSIQIVTGNSAAQMANFAKEANRAAKELSTTTTAYTDASLIYYQQGLDDNEVKQRTDITIKAANAAGTSASQMADYLTAVWNSYKIGGEDLEKYVDIMSALGAGTATSLEEIATSMEKVASVGEATGVKFDQLGSIVATVSSVTRQSAETVGTAFKTIFARMADLKLKGSVEEDGVTTTLGLVSNQLKAVGVNVLDVDGNLRDMGTVMEELMQKWYGMDEATQQAVAIAIAGKRQYTQLLALMNNQDLYQQSMGLAQGSEGTLEKQNDTYAKSWEAAQTRVKAAAEGIFDSLVNDDFFIKMNNWLADLLEAIENAIDHMGGFKGILLDIGTIFMSIFHDKIAKGLNNLWTTLTSVTQKGQAELLAMRTAAASMMTETISSFEIGGSYGSAQEADSMTRRAELYAQFVQKAERLTEQEKLVFQYLLDQQKVLEDNAVTQAKLVEEAQQEVNARKQTITMPKSNQLFANAGAMDRYEQNARNAGAARAGLAGINGIVKDPKAMDMTQAQQLKNFLTKFETQAASAGADTTKFQGKIQAVIDAINALDKVNPDFTNVLKALQALGFRFDDLQKKYEKYKASMEGEAVNPNVTSQEAQNYRETADAMEDLSNATERSIEANINAEQSSENLGRNLHNAGDGAKSAADKFTTMASTIMSASMVINTLTSMIDTLSDSSLSWGDRIKAFLTQIPMLLMGVVSVINVLNAAAKKLDMTLKEMILSNPYLLAIAIALTAILSGIIIVTKVIEGKRRALENAAKRADELAEKNRELAQSAKDSADELEDLQKRIEDQQKSGEDTSEAYEELNNKLIEIRKNYEELGISNATLDLINQAEAIAKATGNWEIYNEAIKQANEEAADIVIQTQQANLLAQSQYAQSKMTEGIGFAKGLNEGTTRVKVGAGSNAELKAFKDSGLLSHGDLVLDLSNGEAILDTYEKLGNLKDQLILLGDESASVDKVSEAYERMEEIVEKVKESFDELTESVLENTYADLDISDFSTMDDYIDLLGKGTEALEQQGFSAEEAAKKVENYLGSFSNLGPAKAYFNFMEQAANKIATSVAADQNDKNNASLVARKAASDFINEFMSLNDKDKAIALNIKLDYVDSVDEFKTVLESLKDQAAQIKIDVNPEGSLKVAKDFRDDFSSIMENYKKQGYLTTSQTADFLTKNPEYDAYFIKTSQGYAVTTNAVQKFNNALKDEQKALDALLDTSTIANRAMTDFTKALASIQVAGNNDFQILISDLEDTSISFINGKISIEEYFNILNEKISSINEGMIDSKTLTESVIPEMAKGIGSFKTSMESAFENGQISSTEYRDSIRKTATSIQKLLEKQRDFGDQSEKLNAHLEVLTKSLNDLNDFEGLASIIEKNYDIFTKFFNNDYTLKVNTDALTTMPGELDTVLNQFRQQFNSLNSDSAKINVLESIANINRESKQIVTATGNNVDDVVSQFQTGIDKINTVAINLITGTSTTAVTGSAKSSEAIGIIAKATGKAISQTSSETKQIISDLETILSNFHATLSVSVIDINAGGIVDAITDSIKKNSPVSLDLGSIQIKGKDVGFTGGGNSSSGNSSSGDSGDNSNKSSNSKPSFWDFWKKRLGIPTKNSNDDSDNNNADSNTITDNSSDKDEAVENAFDRIWNKLINDNQNVLNNFNPNPGGTGDPDDTNTDNYNGYKSHQKTKAQHTKPEYYEDPLRVADEVERYQNINTELEAHSRLLEKIGREKDHAFGKNYINNLNKEIEALKKENELLDKKDAERKAYQQIDIGTLTALGLTPEFNEYGNITNAEQLQAAIMEMKNANSKNFTDSKNAAAAAYDSAVNSENQSYDNLVNSYAEDPYTKDSPEKDAARDAHNERLDNYQIEYDAQLHNIEKIRDARNLELEDGLKAIDNLNEAADEAYEDQVKREENLIQIRSNILETITKEYEIRRKLLDMELGQVDVLRATFREGLYGMADTTRADQLEISTLLKDLDNLNQEYEKLQEARNSPDGLNDEEYYEQLLEINSAAASTTQSIIELSNAIGKRFAEAVQAADDEVNEAIGLFGHLETLLDSISNLTELTFGKDSKDYFDRMSGVYDNLENISLTQMNENLAMEATRRQQAQEQRDLYWKMKKQGASDTELDILEDTITTMEESARSFQEAAYENMEAYANAIIGKYGLEAERINKQLEDRLTSGRGFDSLKLEMDMLGATDEDYLTKINQEYETQKMIRTAMTAMDKTSNQAAKNKLSLFIKETEELQKQNRLSKYELELQQRRYEITLAEIALQEAQDNKSTVRLQRDTEGNFSYVYTADENKVAEAQQKLEDARNDLYNYARESLNTIGQEALELTEEYNERMEEINNNNLLNDVQKAEQFAELREWYLQRMMDLTEQANLTMEYSDDAYNDSYANNVRDELATVDEFKAAHDEASKDVIANTRELQEKTKQYTDYIDADYIDVGGNAEVYASKVTSAMSTTGQALSVIQAQTGSWASTMCSAVNSVVAAFNALSGAIQHSVEAGSGYMADIDYSQMFMDATEWGAIMEFAESRQFVTENNIGGKGKWGMNTEGGWDMWSVPDYSAMLTTETNPNLLAQIAMHRIAKMASSGDYYSSVLDTKTLLSNRFGSDSSEFQTIIDIMKAHGFPGFKSGGYTGDFGPGEKLGLLHEKELVLNQTDTQNLLDTVSLVDKILSNQNYSLLMQDFNASNIGSELGNRSDTLEQEVTIHAEFPNVQDRNEIEQALMNLTNAAAQYASKRRR